MNIETRHLAERPEFRSDGTGKNIVAAGYAALFNVRSKDLGGFVEVVLPSAFTKTLQETNVRAYQDHNRALYLGCTENGTVRLATDNRGLHYEIDLPDTSVGRDAAALLERRDMTGSSFGFKSHGGTSTVAVESDGTLLRSLRDVALHHVSPLTEEPAYQGTNVELAFRSIALAGGVDLEELTAARENGGNIAELFQRSTESTNDDNGTNEQGTRPPTHRSKVRRYRRVE